MQPVPTQEQHWHPMRREERLVHEERGLQTAMQIAQAYPSRLCAQREILLDLCRAAMPPAVQGLGGMSAVQKAVSTALKSETKDFFVLPRCPPAKLQSVHPRECVWHKAMHVWRVVRVMLQPAVFCFQSSAEQPIYISRVMNVHGRKAFVREVFVCAARAQSHETVLGMVVWLGHWNMRRVLLFLCARRQPHAPLQGVKHP